MEPWSTEARVSVPPPEPLAPVAAFVPPLHAATTAVTAIAATRTGRLEFFMVSPGRNGHCGQLMRGLGAGYGGAEGVRAGGEPNGRPGAGGLDSEDPRPIPGGRVALADA